jgi:spermidine/putrescine transport system substrate-binding protein
MALSRRDFLLGSLGLGLASCTGQSPAPTPTLKPVLPQKLIFYDWAEDMPKAVLEAFSKDSGIAVEYLAYDSQELAADAIRNGQVFDVVVLEAQVLSGLLRDQLIHPLNFNNIPNFRNISANFRDLAFDPANKHSVPYQWGTSGLVYRTDLLPAPAPTSWLDLWRPDLQGKVTSWDLPRYGVGATLKGLGYSINATDSAQLDAAQQKLMALVPNMWGLSTSTDTSAKTISSGQAILGVGFSDDAQIASNNVVQAGGQANAINYVLPKEGGMLWGDNFVIPANSSNTYAGELFINFMLQPEISAQISNANFYATPNDVALPLVEKEIRDNPWIYPPSEQLAGAEFFLALPSAVEAKYRSIWSEFTAALPTPQPEGQ